ncbi:Gfo/Idh/MocA family protein [Gulosibacter sp. 10]|uniref:Gfo/Idh/MocA family protein n=1 Tax=Gulosibacter sp. 10 TaxID=1255570 RepID=UPI00097EE406|nr:Gfo/Idh/MocA family oxidoreductase [Gulosibacter sp. 10]SJM62660.1 Myo-inositol 2-dehydrogenase [Gulosibacter sp. 10]
MINAAIIGLGRWGRRLVTSVQGPDSDPSGSIRFTAAATGRPERARDFADRHGLALYPDLTALLASADVEAVVIASPHSLHAAHVREALEAGKDVFVEKPLALELRAAQELVELADARRRTLVVGFNRRLLQAYRFVADAVHEGRIGTPLHVEGNFSGPFGLGYAKEAWHANPAETPAGGLTLMAVHVIDAFIGLLGPVERVATRSRRQVLTVDIDDTTDLALDFVSGRTGYVSTLTATPSCWRLQIFGTRGWLQMNDQWTVTSSTEEGVDTHTFARGDLERSELEAFAEAVTSGDRARLAPLPEVLNGIGVLEAAVRSLDAGGAPSPVE